MDYIINMYKIYKYVVLLLFCISCNATIISVDKLANLQDYLVRVPEIGQFNKIIQSTSSAVVLIYSISDKAKNDHYFYNISIKPRTSEFDYKYGITSGVVISNDGIVVTPYDCVKHANRFIVSVNSEKKSTATYGELSVTKNDFEASIIKAIPELNLAFLRIVNHSNRKFEYLNIANDSAITNTKIKNFLINGGVVYSKCFGEFFVSERHPRVNKNLFTDYKLFCSRISADIFDGVRYLVIYNPVLPERVIPELHGGAIMTLDSTLLGIAIYKKNTNAPISLAIPASTIKKGMQLATPWLMKFSEQSKLGFEIEPLDSNQKKQLAKIINSWPKILLNEISRIFPKSIDGEKFNELEVEALKGHCGVAIKSIVEGGISASSGIELGDIIISVDGVGVTGTDCFYNLESQSIGNQCVEICIVPSGKKKKNESVVYIQIDKNTNQSNRKTKPSESKKEEYTSSILNRIKIAIQKLKYDKKTLVD